MKTEFAIYALPTYPDGTKVCLNKINYFFGKNGSGKSTLCEFFRKNPNSLVDNNQELIIYDRKFRRTQIIDGMRGIYTFGNENPQLISQIENMNGEIKQLSESSEKLRDNVEKLITSRNKTFEKYSESLWAYKGKVIEKYGQDVFRGYNSDKVKFANELLRVFEEKSKDESDPNKIDEYLKIVQKETLEEIEEYSSIRVIDIEEIRGYSIFLESIISHSNDDLNKFYQKLKNTDWVKHGITYLDDSVDECPFCKSILDASFKNRLKNVFDKLYYEKITLLSSFVDEYSSYLDEVELQINNMLSNKNDNFDYSELEVQAKKLSAPISRNKAILNKKTTEVAKTFELEDVFQIIDYINGCIILLNEKIRDHNTLIKNKKKIQVELSKAIWIITAKDNYSECNGQKKANNSYDKRIKTLELEIHENETKSNSLRGDIREISKNITNIEAAIVNINNLLNNFGFSNFTIVVNPEIPGTYIIQRPKGTNGDITTLSEGECKLVSFLYFFCMLYGSLDPSNNTKRIITVLDDPVNSMDGDTMSIVSSLIKRLIDDTLNQKIRIDQMIILTHNVFFHKQIEWRSTKHKKMICYHSITKIDNISTITATPNTEIYSNYEQIWADYKNNSSPTSTFNCMRRIIEYYFKSLVGVDDYNECRSKFDIKDLVFFDHLISMLHAGSHTIFDPMDTYVDSESIMHYKKIFRLIFEKSGNIGHYNSMMEHS